jgi:hypothetical protein
LCGSGFLLVSTGGGGASEALLGHESRYWSRVADRFDVTLTPATRQRLVATQQAVELRRELVELNRDAYLPDLAGSVNNLAIGLAEVGRRAEGLTRALEASAYYHDLAEAEPDVFRSAAERADNLVTALRKNES